MTNPKPRDFGLYVCFNDDTNEVAVCCWCARSQVFKNLSDIERGDFTATHWWEKPEPTMMELQLC